MLVILFNLSRAGNMTNSLATWNGWKLQSVANHLSKFYDDNLLVPLPKWVINPIKINQNSLTKLLQITKGASGSMSRQNNSSDKLQIFSFFSHF